MPTLFRFLLILGVIAGVITGSLYVLAEYFQPEPKEISKALRNVKGRLDETTAATPSAETDAAAPAEDTGSGAGVGRSKPRPPPGRGASRPRKGLTLGRTADRNAAETPRSLRSSSTCSPPSAERRLIPSKPIRATSPIFSPSSPPRERTRKPPRPTMSAPISPDSRAKGLAPTSRARKLSAIRQFFRFLLGEGLRADDPCSAIDSPKLGRPLPKILSLAEVETLLETAKDASETAEEGTARRRALRLYAALETLYATGLRVSELIALPRNVLTADDRVLTVKGKGRARAARAPERGGSIGASRSPRRGPRR